MANPKINPPTWQMHIFENWRKISPIKEKLLNKIVKIVVQVINLLYLSPYKSMVPKEQEERTLNELPLFYQIKSVLEPNKQILTKSQKPYPNLPTVT